MSNLQPVGRILALTFVCPRNTRITRKEVNYEPVDRNFRVFSRVSWAKNNSDRKQRRDGRGKSAGHCCWALGKKRDMIASSTITTSASAPQKM
jgi:hypothetical protein